MNKHDKYIKDVYSKYWLTAREKIYGFLEYDKKLLEFIYANSKKSDKILDICCGTGFPFLNELLKNNYKNIFANDIALNLLMKSNINYKPIKYINSNVHNICFKSNTFDCVYCFHSSWYFSNFFKAFINMLNITKKILLIDMQNGSNFNFKFNFYYNSIYSKIIRIINNFRHYIHKRHNKIIWNFKNDSKLIDVNKIIKFLEKNKLNYKMFNNNLDIVNKHSYKKYKRLIFSIRK